MIHFVFFLAFFPQTFQELFLRNMYNHVIGSNTPNNLRPPLKQCRTQEQLWECFFVICWHSIIDPLKVEANYEPWLAHLVF